MRSLQVFQIDTTNEKNYTELRVLKSYQGWYIGTLFKEEGSQSPGSRDSCYFSSKEDADLALALLIHMSKRWPVERTQQGLDTWGTYIYSLGLDPERVGYRMKP